MEKKKVQVVRHIIKSILETVHNCQYSVQSTLYFYDGKFFKTYKEVLLFFPDNEIEIVNKYKTIRTCERLKLNTHTA